MSRDVPTQAIPVIVPDLRQHWETNRLLRSYGLTPGSGSSSVNSLPEISCYLIRVAGSGIPATLDAPSAPTNCLLSSTVSSTLVASEDLGIISSPIPASGGTITLDVPVGAARKFQLLGVSTSTGDCPGTTKELFDSMKSERDTSETREASLEFRGDVPFVLAENTSDISDDTSLNLSPEIESDYISPLFCNGSAVPQGEALYIKSVQLSESAVGAIDVELIGSLNQAVLGIDESDLILPSSEGVELISIGTAGFRSISIVIRVFPSLLAATQIAEANFLNLVIPEDSFTDWYGRDNERLEANLTVEFLALAGTLFEELQDNVAPQITQVRGFTNSTAGNPYGLFTQFTLQLTFSEPVEVTGGLPVILMNTGGQAPYLSGSGTTTLSFVYTVNHGQATPMLDAQGLLLGAGTTITDLAGNSANLELPGSGSGNTLGEDAVYVIDGISPEIESSALDRTMGSSTTTPIVSVDLSRTEPVASDVSVYSDSSCSGDPIATGSIAASTTNTTIPIPPAALTLNTLYHFSVQVRDPAQNPSVCMPLSPYRILNLVVEPLYPGFGDWLSFLKTSSASGSPVACVGNEAASTDSCIHGGEKLKVSIPTFTSCDGLELSDELNWMQWECEMDAEGGIRFVSTLRDDVGLKDLISVNSVGATAIFNTSNFITLSDDTDSLSSAGGTAWWNNPITYIGDGHSSGLFTATTPQSLTPTTMGTIYVLDPTAFVTNLPSITLASDQIGVLITEGAQFQHPATSTGPLLAVAPGKKFVWIEGPGTEAAVLVGAFTTSPIPLISVDGGSEITIRDLSLSGGRVGLEINATSGPTSFIRLSNLQVKSTDGLGSSPYYDDGVGFRFVGHPNPIGNLRGENLVAQSNENIGMVLLGRVGQFEFSHIGLHSQWLGTNSHGLWITSSSTDPTFVPGNGSFNDLIVSNNSGNGIYVERTSAPADNRPIRFFNTRATNNGGSGITLGSPVTTFPVSKVYFTQTISAFNSSYGVYVAGSATHRATQIHFAGLSALNNFQSGIKLSTTQGVILHNLVSQGNGQGRGSANAAGIYAADTYALNLSQASFLANEQVAITTSGAGGFIGGNLVIDEDRCNSTVMGGSAQNVIGFNCSSVIESFAEGFRLLTTATTALGGSPFAGPVVSDSLSSSSTGTLNPNVPSTQLTEFDNSFRSIGMGTAQTTGTMPIPGTFQGGDFVGRCTTMPCQIFDFSLSTTESILRGKTNDLQNPNTPSTSDSVCSSASSLDRVIVNTTAGLTYHRNAIERYADDIGDDDGLCESDEECLYTPNLGAYQGHNSDTSLGGDQDPMACEIPSASGSPALSGVTMYHFLENGR